MASSYFAHCLKYINEKAMLLRESYNFINNEIKTRIVYAIN